MGGLLHINPTLVGLLFRGAVVEGDKKYPPIGIALLVGLGGNRLARLYINSCD